MWGILTDITQDFVFIVLIFWLVRITKEVQNHNRGHWHEPPTDPQPICGCNHHQCFHDEDGCGYIETSHGFLRDDPIRVGICGCKHYTGPEQLPQVIP